MAKKKFEFYPRPRHYEAASWCAKNKYKVYIKPTQRSGSPYKVVVEFGSKTKESESQYDTIEEAGAALFELRVKIKEKANGNNQKTKESSKLSQK
jgi:hypothetical protein